jgi:NAD(P) transhydrogenase subunit alpha
MKIAVLQETYPHERRVALVPASIPPLSKAGLEVLVEQGAGLSAGFPDDQYVSKGGRMVADRGELFRADILLQVRTFGANAQAGRADLQHMSARSVLIGTCDPLGAPEAVREMAQTGASVFALELIPRITRAQSMDVLSSQATIAGYRAVLVAAIELPKMFPMLMTAAGTVAAPARSSSERVSPACRRLPRRVVWERSSRPTTCARPRANRSRAWVGSSSN